MKPTDTLRAATALLTLVALTACGTTSSLQTTDAAKSIDLTKYSRLIVEDFADEATSRAKPETQALLKPKLDVAVKTFPEQIASVIRARGGFSEVLRTGAPDASTLVLRGAITQFDEGNAALRWIVGFGAGNVNFDSRLQLVDGGTGQPLGSWTVDKNSWALGGGIAATQTPEGFMQEAAKKIGTELSTKRKEGSFQPPSRKRKS
jgi:predicted small lipoprotein YifL